MVESERNLFAFLYVLQRVAIFVRHHSSGSRRLTDDHLSDLMDAIHNVPEMLSRAGHYFTPEMIREDFARFDSKWGARGISLVATLEDGFSAFDAIAVPNK